MIANLNAHVAGADFYLAEFPYCANVLKEESVFVHDQHVLHLGGACDDEHHDQDDDDYDDHNDENDDDNDLASPWKFYISGTFHCVRDDSLQILDCANLHDDYDDFDDCDACDHICYFHSTEEDSLKILNSANHYDDSDAIVMIVVICGT